MTETTTPIINFVEQVQNLKTAIAEVVGNVVSELPANIVAAPKSFAERVRPTQIPETVVGEDLAKILKLTALFDLVTPHKPSLTSKLKTDNNLRSLDTDKLLLGGERITCVSQVHTIIQDAGLVIAEHSLAAFYSDKARSAIKQLVALSADQSNTWLLSDMETKLSQAQNSYTQRSAA